MEIVYDRKDLENYFKYAVVASGKHPILIDKFLVNATEVDVDAVSDGTDTYVAGVMFPDKGETATLAGTLEYDSQAGKLTFSELVLEGLGLRATGRIDGAVGKPEAGTRLVWQFATNTFSPKALLASLGIRLTGLPDDALSSLETKGELVFSPTALGLTLRDMRLDGQNIAFTAQVTVLLMMALKFGRCRRLSRDEGLTYCEEIARIPKMIEAVLAQNDAIAKIAEKYAKINNAFFIGRGILYPTALEGALKLKEVSYIHVPFYL